MAVEQIGTGQPDGVTLAGSSTELASMHGADPIARYTTIAAVATTWTVGTSTATVPLYGYTTSTEAAALSTSLNAVIACLKAKGIVLAA